MRRHGHRLPTVAVILVLGACSSDDDEPAAPQAGDAAGAAVTIQNFSFDPAELEVEAGTAVTATNDDSVAHTWTADDGAFDSGNLASGESFKHVLDEAGTFTYHCTLHPTMTGEVTVT